MATEGGKQDGEWAVGRWALQMQREVCAIRGLAVRRSFSHLEKDNPGHEIEACVFCCACLLPLLLR